MKKTFFWPVVALVLSALGAVPAAGPGLSGPLTMKQADDGGIALSLRNEAQAAIARGLQWLEAQQSPQGTWSSPEMPALTGLPLWALAQGGSTNKAAMDKAVQAILSAVHPDGSIWREPKSKQKGGGLANYNTAICMVALQATRDPRLTPYILKARSFVAGTQHLGADEYRGGMGYDAGTDRAYADLSNSYMAYEAMRLTQGVEDQRRAGEQRADLDWAAAREFLGRIQNKPAGTNDANAGGFAYHPAKSMAGTVTNAEGVVVFRSYGSMTYAGLLSLIYADVRRDDVRVRSAFDWSMRHWSLKENPGMGADGLYYFFNVLSKTLAVYDENPIRPANQGAINWREELVHRLVSLQRIDPANGRGWWVNDAGRWWENDPVLATSYALVALEVAVSETAR